MTVAAVEIIRDKTCNYCSMSQYRDNYDGRKFYRLLAHGDVTRVTVDICEYCTQDIISTLAGIMDDDTGELIDYIYGLPIDIRKEVISNFKLYLIRLYEERA